MDGIEQLLELFSVHLAAAVSVHKAEGDLQVIQGYGQQGAEEQELVKPDLAVAVNVELEDELGAIGAFLRTLVWLHMRAGFSWQ